MLNYGENIRLLADSFMVRVPIFFVKLLIINATEKYYTLNIQFKKDF